MMDVVQTNRDGRERKKEKGPAHFLKEVLFHNQRTGCHGGNRVVMCRQVHMNLTTNTNKQSPDGEKMRR